MTGSLCVTSDHEEIPKLISACERLCFFYLSVLEYITKATCDQKGKISGPYHHNLFSSERLWKNTPTFVTFQRKRAFLITFPMGMSRFTKAN